MRLVFKTQREKLRYANDMGEKEFAVVVETTTTHNGSQHTFKDDVLYYPGFSPVHNLTQKTRFWKSSEVGEKTPIRTPNESDYISFQEDN